MLDIQFTDDSSTAPRLQVRGRLDRETRGQFMQTIHDLVVRGSRRVSIDLREVALLDPDGALAIHEASERLEAAGGTLVLLME